MQVKCICNKGVEDDLTVGKAYNVIERPEDFISIQNDKGYTFRYRDHRFENVPAEPSGKVMTFILTTGMLGFTYGKNYNVVQSDKFEECYTTLDDERVRCHIGKKHFIEPSQQPTHRAPSFGCGKQIGGTHYKKNDPIQFAIDNYPSEQLEGFFRINIDKYVARYPDKNGLEDLYKARDYLNRLIELKEGEK